MTHQINSEEWRFNTNKHGGSREFRFDAYISSRITTVIQVVRDYQINYNWYNEPSAVSIKYLILTHAWLNLWDERMTTGRINQVATRTRGFNAAKVTCTRVPLLESSSITCFPIVRMLPILNFRSSVQYPVRRISRSSKQASRLANRRYRAWPLTPLSALRLEGQ